MEYPIIKTIKINTEFSYLWLKYVDDFDLSNHCAKALVGSYSKLIFSKMTSAKDLLLNEADSKLYYLCGVAKPFNYKNNFHLAFKYSKGNKIAIDENGILIIIENVERIVIKKRDFYNHEKRENKRFTTCRNWQFAYQQKVK
jgi:hypothetical protein